MKISKLIFENFRNFKGLNEMVFPTDGSISIIYGTNGVGKTTLHQLFQWIFYGNVHFNKTASNKMYNLEYEDELGYGKLFHVKGTIDFEHPNRDGIVEKYSLTRDWIYRKELPESKLQEQQCRLLKLVGDDWKPLKEEPRVIIEKILPSGLSPYFFFDGESMIADLSLKGKDSAKSFRKALHSIFDLDVYEQAAVHIGDTSTKSTVLGSLYLKQGEAITSGQLLVLKGQLNQAMSHLEKAKNDSKTNQDILDRIEEEILQLSEKIGTNPSRKSLEDKRKKHNNNIKQYEENIAAEKMRFGQTAYDYYPKLLVANVVQQAHDRIGLKVTEEHLTPGVTKPLIDALKNEPVCLCGHAIGEEELANFEMLLHMLPPLSYKSMFDNFDKTAKHYKTDYNPELLVGHITKIFKYKDLIAQELEEISEIDEQLKNGTDVDSFIEQRKEKENRRKVFLNKKSEADKQVGLYEKLYNQAQKKFDDAVEKYGAKTDVALKIEVMKSVKEYFQSKLSSVANEYSKKLENSIQDLVNTMLTSTRIVKMSPAFELSVTDSFGDEAKSEGQFAVISFAYIGGIFKLLSEESVLKDKEYPLILDGPFSKLDVIQRQNVINTIPSYAPQVILFSKDDLTECLSNNESIWTIFGNDERNVSEVKKGYYPEVFEL